MLHHVSLEVDPDEADRFGELLETLGFSAFPVPEALGSSVRWFDCEGTQIHLILTEAATAPALGHPALVARELWGERRAFVLAPSGHRIELMAAPPR